ncbi:E3 ubiquitin-protein ligase TRIM7-like [Dendrobates tinctorius]|uniref:E3 ubiquitin-protein ligase TRIM7-like n=1 Tax=Dendrobates tinctorius TaxID=92724 RepID=UPI003CC9493E
MASAAVAEDQTCFTCIYLCSSLVTLRCGHVVCEDCKKETSQEDEQCFECKAKSEKESKVLCTYCVNLSVPAVKSCRVCEASLCETHLSVHNKSPDHVLIEPTSSLRCQKCTIHNEVLKYYCPEDDSVICVSCFLIGNHKGHAVQLLQSASEKKKEKLVGLLRRRILRKEKTQNRIKDLESEMENAKDKAKAIKDQVDVLFTNIRAQLYALERRVLREVSKQEEQVMHCLSEQVQELEIKVKNISKQISDIEKLCQMTDPLTILTGRLPGSLTVSDGYSRRMSDEPLNQVKSLDKVLISMTLHRNLAKIVSNVSAMEELQLLEASEIILDEKTAGDYVLLSGDLKTACKSKLNLRRPERPEKFYCVQVLSTKSFLSGRHSWEVEASDCGDWMIGVAYATIERKGTLSFLGINDHSWVLTRSNNRYSVKHNSEIIHIDVAYSCQRYLIYLDLEAGQLSFYQLSDPICHLYSYKTIFHSPLHAAFWVEDDAWVKIS